jgi:hypothetical protein
VLKRLPARLLDCPIKRRGCNQIASRATHRRFKRIVNSRFAEHGILQDNKLPAPQPARRFRSSVTSDRRNLRQTICMAPEYEYYENDFRILAQI